MALLLIALPQVDGFTEEPEAVLFDAESSLQASATTSSRPASQVYAT